MQVYYIMLPRRLWNTNHSAYYIMHTHKNTIIFAILPIYHLIKNAIGTNTSLWIIPIFKEIEVIKMFLIVPFPWKVFSLARWNKKMMIHSLIHLFIQRKFLLSQSFHSYGRKCEVKILMSMSVGISTKKKNKAGILENTERPSQIHCLGKGSLIRREWNRGLNGIRE